MTINTEYLFYAVTVLPIVAGIIIGLMPEMLRRISVFIGLMVSAAALICSIFIFTEHPVILMFSQPVDLLFKADNLSSLMLLGITFFGFLAVVYSTKSIKTNFSRYCGYYLMMIGSSSLVVFSQHLVMMVIAWGFTGFLLYRLACLSGFKASSTAKKSFLIIGGTDALMILGITIIWVLTGSWAIGSRPIDMDKPLAVVALLCLFSAGFAKAGAMPFHTWIPDFARDTPAVVSALLPASLDKLLGIYLIFRVVTDMFAFNSTINMILLVAGSATILAAVMMALVQHDLKRLLGYHAVSQVGYMILGIGTGIPIGIAGGLFHMINHTIYKSCLFLNGGAVEYRTNTTDLDKLGGLAKSMPLTFAAGLVAVLSISGVPPMNGFFSKWMIYQGIIESAKSGGHLWIIWLVAAMFGSALTLASFMKLIHAVWLGRSSGENNYKESPLAMLVPMFALAFLCVLFGIFAVKVPLKYFIIPIVPGSGAWTGNWQPGLATILLLVALIIGVIIYLVGKFYRVRIEENFFGGETLKPEERVTGTGFYQNIRENAFLAPFYDRAARGYFDIYEVSRKFSLSFANLLRGAHTGFLSTYLTWLLIGFVILLWVLLG